MAGSSKVSSAAKERLEHFARGMRRHPTSSECMLWRALRGRRLGVRFQRQVVIGPYIVDFLAPRARLVVEVDGGYHGECAAADRRRQRWLERQGYTVLRLAAATVLLETALAVRAVVEALAALGARE